MTTVKWSSDLPLSVIVMNRFLQPTMLAGIPRPFKLQRSAYYLSSIWSLCCRDLFMYLKIINLIDDFHVKMSLSLITDQTLIWQCKIIIIISMFEEFCCTWKRFFWRLFIPLLGLRSYLRIGKYSTVILNVWANGPPKIVEEHIVCLTQAKCALLFHFTSPCPQFWSVILCGKHRYSQR